MATKLRAFIEELKKGSAISNDPFADNYYDVAAECKRSLESDALEGEWQLKRAQAKVQKTMNEERFKGLKNIMKNGDKLK